MHKFLALCLGGLVLTASLLPAVPGAPETKPYAPRIAAASDEGLKAIKRFRLPAGMQATLWAAEPLLANPVSFAFDEKGRCFVAETFRLGRGVTDNRSHFSWLDDDIACRTVADRVAMYRKHLKDKFGSYEVEHDRVRLIEDAQGKGVADKATVFADGFRTAADGLGSGVLAHKGNVWYTCIPDLWLLRDTKGTGKADIRKSLGTGFGVHVSFIGHDMHGLTIGPDGRLYFSIGDRGLNVITPDGKKLAAPDTGAVLRCELDGSNMEIFATGLRNPQELAFDEFGNLFTGDNNSDSGDAARWVYLVEGGDSGWRIGYQYGSSLSNRGPWNAEKIWHLPNPEQPAYVVPPLAHVAAGPSGLCFNPGGAALAERYNGHFFLCDFRGSSGGSGVHTFAVKPKGASFEVVDRQQFVWSILATDCDFGPDGGFYVSDWVEGWGLTGKGRIYRFADPEAEKKPIVAEVKKLLAEGFEQRSVKELARLLEHADKRIRQQAQLELASRGSPEALTALADVARGSKNRLARLHAIWGLGQLGRRDSSRLAPVLALLGDSDAEVRAQAARVLGEGAFAAAAPRLIALLKDSEPRVRAFAAGALGHLKDHSAVKPLLELLRDNADGDPYLRHAAVMGLMGMSPEELLAARNDPSPSVRLGLVLVLRRQHQPLLRQFLSDPDPRVFLEAVRALHDEGVAGGMEALAGLIHKPNLPEMALYRILNAHFRLGKPENARALAAFAGRASAPEKLRLEAVQMLGTWDKPGRRDRVTGLTQALPARPREDAVVALRGNLAGIVTGPDKLRLEAAKVAGKLGIKEIDATLRQFAQDSSQPAVMRVESLQALHALKAERLDNLLDGLLKDKQPAVRAETRRQLALLRPGQALPLLQEALDRGETVERQGRWPLWPPCQEPRSSRSSPASLICCCKANCRWNCTWT